MRIRADGASIQIDGGPPIRVESIEFDFRPADADRQVLFVVLGPNPKHDVAVRTRCSDELVNQIAGEPFRRDGFVVLYWREAPVLHWWGWSGEVTNYVGVSFPMRLTRRGLRGCLARAFRRFGLME